MGEQAIIAFEERNLSLFNALATIKEQKEQLEKEEKEIKECLCRRMDECGIAAVDNDYVRINYIPATESVSLDTKAFKADDPELYHEIENRYNKRVKKKAYVRITVK